MPSESATIVGPSLLWYELTNALHRLRAAGLLPPDQVSAALAAAGGLGIETHQDHSLHQRAAELAALHHLPAAYDAHYLALAERLAVPFHTADRRLYNSVSDQLPYVHLVTTDPT